MELGLPGTFQISFPIREGTTRVAKVVLVIADESRPHAKPLAFDQMPETAITYITNMIQVEVRDEDIIKGFTTKHSFNIRTDDLRLRARVPGALARIEK